MLLLQANNAANKLRLAVYFILFLRFAFNWSERLCCRLVSGMAM